MNVFGVLVLIALVVGLMMANAALQRKQLQARPHWVCTTCGFSGPIDAEKPGSGAVELVLWLLLIVPGIIYSVWRSTSRAERICPKCGGRAVVPQRSPIGHAISTNSQSPRATLPSPPLLVSGSRSDRLRELKQLHEEGLISDSEYEKRRSSVIAEI